MRASYGKYEENYSARYARRKAGRRRQGRGMSLGYRERQRLLQLLICFLLFAVALVGKGVFPQQTDAWKDNLMTVLQSDTDFKAAFVGLGRAISDGEPILETVGKWIETVGGGTSPAINQDNPIQTPIYEQELTLLAEASKGSQMELLSRKMGVELQTLHETDNTTADKTDIAVNETAGWAEREDASQPAVLEAKPQPVYNGPELPANCTMDNVKLELSETTTPVLGVISSGFGYRIHPIDGENKFHYGADVAADVGTPVLAFADGVVDFIGESEAYGQYIQLSHEGGLTTFYAHCSKLCAKKGQKVNMGDVIAKVGESGNTTGPHLHFEIRLNGTYLNPLNYIDTL